MNKKGFFLDGTFLIFIFIGFLFEYLIIGFVFDNINYNMRAAVNATDMVDNEAYVVIDTMLDEVDEVMVMDWIVVFGLFGMFLALIISLYYIRSSPLFVIIGIISAILLVFLAILFKDTFFEFFSNDNIFSDYISENHELIVEVMNYFPVIILIFCIIIIILLYSWSGVGGGYVGWVIFILILAFVIFVWLVYFLLGMNLFLIFVVKLGRIFWKNGGAINNE